MRISIFFLSLFGCILSFCQSSKEHHTMVRLAITDTTGRGIATIVCFKNIKTQEMMSFKCNKRGLVDCVIPTGYKYSITIPESDDMVEYFIPKISLPELQLNIQFNRKDNLSP